MNFDSKKLLLFLLPLAPLVDNLLFGSSTLVDFQVVLVVALFVAYIYKMVQRGWIKSIELKITSAVILIILFIFLHSYSLVNARHFTIVTTVIGVFLSLLIFLYWFDISDHYKVLRSSLICIGLYLVITAAMYSFWGFGERFIEMEINTGLGRLSSFGFFFRRNTGYSDFSMGAYGSYVEVSMCMMLTFFLESKRDQNFWKKLLAYLAIPIGVAGIIFSQSRSQLVATVIGILCFLFLYYFTQTKNKRVLGYSFFACLVLVLSTFFIYQWDFLVSIGSHAVSQRISTSILALDLISDGPLMGNGFYAVSEIFGTETILHNHYLAYPVALGIPISLIYFWIYWKAIKEGVKYLSINENTPFMIGLLSSLASVMVENGFYRALGTPITYILLGAILSVKKRFNEKD